jgi:signal transduction histidine kinase
VLNCVRVGVTVIERETRFMRALAVVGLSSEEEAQLWAMQSENVRFDESGDPELAARLAAGELVVVDVTQPPYDQQPNPFGVTVALGVPMRLHGEFIGILSLDHAGERHVFSADELALAQGVADLAALVIERERLQAEATAAQAQALALAETNARMNTFLGIAGHELRTPVTSIKSSVQLTARAVRQALDAALPDDLKGRMARAAHLLDGANDQADKLNRFITDLLDITHIQAGTLEMQPAAVDFAAVIRQGVAGVQPAWPQRTITLTIPTAPVMVWGDADRLGQVVTNLLTNALKYSPDAQPVEVQLTRAEATARLAVTDHGPGLSVEQQAQLFQPFGRATGIERQSGAGVGLGLGLFICKTIIERHQGAIGVTSQPGVGATFWCSLPLWERA